MYAAPTILLLSDIEFAGLISLSFYIRGVAKWGRVWNIMKNEKKADGAGIEVQEAGKRWNIT